MNLTHCDITLEDDECNNYVMTDTGEPGLDPAGEESISPDPIEGDASSHDDSSYQTLAHGYLTPRHRRLCQLAAEGKANALIAEELGYAGSRISILLKHPVIAAEVRRLQDRIFEETIGSRLKSFAEPALNNIHMILTDRTNRVKISEKMALSQWVVEKLDGKAAQKIEAGENLLAALMDRLDAQRTAPRQVIENHIHIGQTAAIDVTPSETPQLSAAPLSEEELLEEWCRDFERQEQSS